MIRKNQVSHVFAVQLSKEEGSEGPVSGDEVPSIQSEMQALVREFTPSVFRDSLPPGLPPDRGIPPVIRLPVGTKAPFGPLYRMSPVELETLRRQIAELLEKGLIEPSSASFGAPCLFTAKKDTTELRLVIDYRRLNALSEPDRGLLPRIDDAYTTMREARVFSAIDLTSGYHQIRLPKEDVSKTSFRTPLGLFQFKVLPFGLRNAPQTFQAVMHRVLGGPCSDYCLAYMDDVLIFSKTPEEHVGHVRSVLERLRAERLYAKPRKCHWGKTRLRLLGHIVSAEGLRVDPAKVAVVRDWARPKDVSQLRSFLGLGNYFRTWVQGWSALVRPLSDLTRKTAVWDWTLACQRAFEGVKTALTAAPVLAQPDFSNDAPGFGVWCDASDFGTGGVLLQGGRVIAFVASSFHDA